MHSKKYIAPSDASMTVMTIATNLQHPLMTTHLVPSTRYYGLSLRILDPGLYWRLLRRLRRRLIGRMRMEFRRKDVVVDRALRTFPRDHVVMVIDAYDTYFVADAKEIHRKYRDSGASILYATEQKCMPGPEFAQRFRADFPIPTYLNGGGCIGTVEALREGYQILRETAADEYPWSNQYHWQVVAEKFPDLVKLDVERQLFLCCAQDMPDDAIRRYAGTPRGSEWQHREFVTLALERLREMIEVDGTRVRFRPTGTLPCLIHFNGAISRLMTHPWFESTKPWVNLGPIARTG